MNSADTLKSVPARHWAAGRYLPPGDRHRSSRARRCRGAGIRHRYGDGLRPRCCAETHCEFAARTGSGYRSSWAPGSRCESRSQGSEPPWAYCRRRRSLLPRGALWRSGQGRRPASKCLATSPGPLFAGLGEAAAAKPSPQSQAVAMCADDANGVRPCCVARLPVARPDFRQRAHGGLNDERHLAPWVLPAQIDFAPLATSHQSRSPAGASVRRKWMTMQRSGGHSSTFMKRRISHMRKPASS